MAQPLAAGEERSVTVAARNPLNRSGIRLERGSTYSFEASGEWVDWTIRTNPDGFSASELRGVPRIVHRTTARLKRLPDVEWFVLCGVIDGAPGSAFAIGSSLASYVATETGELLTFANDLARFYFNNKGSIALRVRRDS